jgi:hypothetical protein
VKDPWRKEADYTRTFVLSSLIIPATLSLSTGAVFGKRFSGYN